MTRSLLTVWLFYEEGKGGGGGGGRTISEEQ